MAAISECLCGAQLPPRRRKCDACRVTRNRPASPAAPVDLTPAGLGERGRQLWSVLGLDLTTAAGHIALEACRTADRLDDIERVIAGKGVLNLLQFRLDHAFGDGDERTVHVTVQFANVLATASAQQITFKTLLAQAQAKTAASPNPHPVPTAPPTNPLDELQERRRRGKAK